MDANRRARALAARLPLGTLSRRLGGTVVAPDDDAYADARRVWNGLVNEYPTAIAYCESVTDVRESVSFAREHEIPTAVRSGGHSVSGASVVSGGLVVDCSRMEWVRVDPDDRVARVGPGATWATFDRATQSFGLATPGGVVSDTGVAGLTLGGGTGYLTPKHGFTADNLRAVDVVTGRGERVTATADRNPALFWAARGGGTPGVVTAFEFDLHPLDHDVCFFESWLPAESAADALRTYRRYQRDAPEESCVSPYFARVPESEDVDFSADRRGDLALVLSGVYTGDPERVREEFEPFLDREDAFAASVETMAYVDLQSAMDHDFPAGRRYYWKSVPLADFDDEAIGALRASAAEAPSALSTVVVWPMHGAIERVPESATPLAGRDADVVVNVEAAWDDPAATPENVEWVRETCRRFRDLTPSHGTLPNFAGGREATAADVYGRDAERLRTVRERYDPDGVFAYERA
ncbi:FAD-binding oxidoreductase [Halobellus rufus]|uniref:FAD-binding oxidoreductase n=1 Tax=Halobellus rufus TaxID=1448860 RepID=UPI0006787700|nr:FAD-binding oxidoreductase [Halobellus rufus]